MYSFAIVMWEVITGEPPFSVRSRHEMEDLVCNLQCGAFVRPPVSSDSEIPKEILDLMENCWNENPNLRPKMKDVLVVFQKQSAGR